MRKSQISCYFEIRTSHTILLPSYSEFNSYGVVGNRRMIPCPFGTLDTDLEFITKNEKANRFEVKINSSIFKENSDSVEYLKNLACYLSFFFGKDEVDGRSGTPFVFPDFKYFKRPEDEKKCESGVQITDLDLNMVKNFDISTIDFKQTQHKDVLRYYYDGLRSNVQKTKYFHWFLIVEYLEKSERYRQMFSKERELLFSEDDKTKIKELSGKMDSRKKQVILSLLTKTSDSRVDKLLRFIKELDIRIPDSSPAYFWRLKIDKPTIKSIIDNRNKLIHEGYKIPEGILMKRLFPFVSIVISKLIDEPECLSICQ